MNVHFHILALDGVFVPDGDTLRFRRLASLDALDVAEVLATIVPGVRRLLSRRGRGAEADDALDQWADTEPVLAGVAAASGQGRVARGPRAGQTLRRRGGPSEEPADWALGACHARQDGFDLHAGVRIPAGHRDTLERICKYALRPPVAADRLRLTTDGQVLLELKRRWSDGTTHLVFDPLELLERLAAIIPRPRINLVLYYGVLGARSAWRAKIVPTQGGTRDEPRGRGVGTCVRVALGDADAAQLRVRCPGLPRLRRAPASHCDHRATRRDSEDLGPSWIADRDPTTTVCARSAVPSRRPSRGRS